MGNETNTELMEIHGPCKCQSEQKEIPHIIDFNFSCKLLRNKTALIQGKQWETLE